MDMVDTLGLKSPKKFLPSIHLNPFLNLRSLYPAIHPNHKLPNLNSQTLSSNSSQAHPSSNTPGVPRFHGFHRLRARRVNQAFRGTCKTSPRLSFAQWHPAIAGLSVSLKGSQPLTPVRPSGLNRTVQTGNWEKI